MATRSTQTGTETETKAVFEEKAPSLSTQEAEAVARLAFDIQASARPLASERDQNFRLFAWRIYWRLSMMVLPVVN